MNYPCIVTSSSSQEMVMCRLKVSEKVSVVD